MLVRFTKGPPSARSDTLICIRSDGTLTEAEMGRQGILPHEAFHWVIENALGARDAFFGRIAGGEDIAIITKRFHASMRKTPPEDISGRQIEAVIACLQADQWGGASDPAAFIKALTQASRDRRVQPRAINAKKLAELRAALRDFGAAWRPLAAGKSIEYRW
jgi:hypothetical protein